MNQAPNFDKYFGQNRQPVEDGFDVMFKSMSIDGVYARTGAYESVVTGLANFISTFREADMEVLRFPPVMSRQRVTSGTPSW